VKKHSAIILAGGSGSRMGMKMPKQYMQLCGRPLLYYSLKVFEQSFIDEMILVTRAGDEEYCHQELIERYDFKKVTAIVPGGSERYLSVYEGIQCIGGSDYIWVHDGARPCLDQVLLEHLKDVVEIKQAVVPGVRVKDTIKQADENHCIIATPKRDSLWSIQTPQVFSGTLLKSAYEKLMAQLADQSFCCQITDDAMVVEQMTSHSVYIVEGNYCNIKITTPEDIEIAKNYI